MDSPAALKLINPNPSPSQYLGNIRFIMFVRFSHPGFGHFYRYAIESRT